jgi:hypothetical protein
VESPAGARVSVCSLNHPEQLEVMQVLANFVDNIASAPPSLVLVEVAVDWNIREDPAREAQPTGAPNQQFCKLVTVHLSICIR